jgi:DNA-binding CsgD family transcriptional regulator
MLEGFLSEDAAALYVRLSLAPDGQLDDARLPADPVAELQRLGLIFRTPGPATRIAPVSAAEAFDRLLRMSERQTRADLDRLGRQLVALGTADQPDPSNAVVPGDDATSLITAIEDPTDIGCVADRLRAEATREFFALVATGNSGEAAEPPLGWPVPPWSGNRAAGTARLLYRPDRAVPPWPAASCRVTRDAPVNAILVDRRVALITLPGVARPALLVHTLPAVRLLHRWYELLWHRGEPVAGGNPPLGPYQRRILTLMAAGHRDAHVARITGTSTRTVRRHIAAIMLELGTSTRFEAGVAAHRRGWFEPSTASAAG